MGSISGNSLAFQLPCNMHAIIEPMGRSCPAVQIIIHRPHKQEKLMIIFHLQNTWKNVLTLLNNM